MSKIKIEEIESVTTASPNSGDLTITPNGSGVFEVAGEENDGLLQLNSIEQRNKVKIQSPNLTAAQNYTMILPATSPTADKFLKVGSIQSGSGASAVGQLEFATVADTDLTQLNASNFTSGTIPADRYSFTGQSGAGLQLIQKQPVTTDGSVNQIDFTGLVDNGMYKAIVKQVVWSSSTYLGIQWLDASGNAHDNIEYYRWDDSDDNLVNSTNNTKVAPYIGANYTTQFYEIEFYTATEHTINHTSSGSYTTNRTFMYVRGYNKGTAPEKSEVYATLANADATDRINGLRFIPISSSSYFNIGTEILLYKYNED